MDIYNYSFYAITEHLKSRGVKDLDDYGDLKSLMTLSFTDTRSDIEDRLQKIVDHALENKVKAVFLRNYDSLQSYMIAQFIKSKIRVFVPFYNSYDVNENIIGKNLVSVITYRVIDEIIEVTYPGFSKLISIEINGKMTITLDNLIMVQHDYLRDIRDFVDVLNVRKISDAINHIFSINVDADRFLALLIAELQNKKAAAEEIEKIRDFIILDSYEVEKYLRLSNYANEMGDTQAIGDAIKIYQGMTDDQKAVVGQLKTKYTMVKRNYDLGYDLATAYELQGRAIDKPRIKVSLEKWERYSVDESRFSELELPLVFTQMSEGGPKIKSRLGEFIDDYINEQDINYFFVKLMTLSGAGLHGYTESVNMLDLHENSKSSLLVFSMNYPNPLAQDRRMRETTIAQFFMLIPKSHLHFVPGLNHLIKIIPELKAFFSSLHEVNERHLKMARNIVTSTFDRVVTSGPLTGNVNVELIMSTLLEHGPQIDHVIGNLSCKYLLNKMNMMDLLVRLSIVQSRENKYIESCNIVDVHSSSRYIAVVFPFNLMVRQESRLLTLLIRKDSDVIIPNVVELNQLLPSVKLKFRNKPTMGVAEIEELGKWILSNFKEETT